MGELPSPSPAERPAEAPGGSGARRGRWEENPPSVAASMASHAATAGLGTPRHMLGEASSMAATLEAEDGAEEEDEYEEDFEVDEATTEEECAGADADADAFSAFGGTLPSTLPGAAGALRIAVDIVSRRG